MTSRKWVALTTHHGYTHLITPGSFKSATSASASRAHLSNTQNPECHFEGETLCLSRDTRSRVSPVFVRAAENTDETLKSSVGSIIRRARLSHLRYIASYEKQDKVMGHYTDFKIAY